MRDHRPGDEELEDDTRAELVSSRRGSSPGLKVIIPTSILAALVAALGFNATNTRTSVNEVRTTIDDRLIVVEHESQAMGTEIAVMRAQFFALQESLKRIEQKLDAAETRERERERRR